jgi:hypothetical protein
MSIWVSTHPNTPLKFGHEDRPVPHTPVGCARRALLTSGSTNKPLGANRASNTVLEPDSPIDLISVWGEMARRNAPGAAVTVAPISILSVYLRNAFRE